MLVQPPAKLSYLLFEKKKEKENNNKQIFIKLDLHHFFALCFSFVCI